MQIRGSWREGYALDFHTVSSVPIGHNESGHLDFDTTRTELGELLFRLKYRSDYAVIGKIVEAAALFVGGWDPGVDTVVPVPPSRQRGTQPVDLLGEALAESLGISFAPNWVEKVSEGSEIKNVQNPSERLRILEGVRTVEGAMAAGARVLVFDDLFQSGSTMKAVTDALKNQGGAKEVFALTITRTRKNR